MGISAIKLIIATAIGLWVISFSRTTFSAPEAYRQRWQPWLPSARWASTLLRCLAVLGMFGGFLWIESGLTVLPFVTAHRGVELATGAAILAAAFAGLLAANTPRRDRSGQ